MTQNEKVMKQDVRIEKQDDKITKQDEKIAAQDEKLVKEDEKMSELEKMVETFKTEIVESLETKFESQNQQISHQNQLATESMESFKTDVRKELETKFASQADAIQAQNEKAGEEMENFQSEVKAEFVTKFTEQEKIVADVAKHSGLLGMVKAMITTRLNEGRTAFYFADHCLISLLQEIMVTLDPILKRESYSSQGDIHRLLPPKSTQAQVAAQRPHCRPRETGTRPS